MISQEETPMPITTAIPIDPEPVEIVVEAHEQQKDALPVDYTKPLEPGLIAIITKEFDAFVQDPKAGWDLTYPTLHKTLQGIVTEICADMHAPVPALLLVFAGTNAHQALVNHMTDGTKQLLIGTEFIRTQLLDSSSKDALLRHRAFRWAIAHEIAHVVDPKLRWWSNFLVYQARIIWQWTATVFIWLAIYNVIFSHVPFLQSYFSNENGFTYLMIGWAMKGLYRGLEIMLHHLFEYWADARSLQTAEHFTTAEPLYALTNMNAAIAQAVAKQEQEAKNVLAGTIEVSYARELKLQILAWKQRIARFELSLLHPALENRIAAMQKQISSVQK